MKNKILTLILLASALCPGCSGWLDVKPYDQISEEELLESEEGFQKLLNGIYIELNSDELYGSTLSVEMIEILGGAYEIGDNSSVWGDYLDLKDYDYNTDYWRGRLNGTWNKAYALILNCNKLLKNIQGRQALFTGHNYDIIRGEALALRAMLHFDMLRLFGPVYSLNPDGTSIPYYADETLTPEALLPASQVVYKVLQDLMAARAALLNDPVITEGTLMSSAGNGSNFLRYRALRLNYYAVSALLARVNLYAGQKQDALTYAVEVIRASNNGIFPFVDRSLVVGNPEDPDRIFSSEVVFALSHAKRSQLFLNYFNPARTTFTFRMESDLISKAIFGGGAETGGYQDDYRNRVNWSTSGENRYFYKYSEHDDPDAAAGRNVPDRRREPVGRAGQRNLLCEHPAPQPRHQHLARGPDARTAQVRVHPRTVRRRSAVLPLQTPLLEGDLVLYRLPEPRTEHEPFRRAAARFGDRKPRITP